MAATGGLRRRRVVNPGGGPQPRPTRSKDVVTEAVAETVYERDQYRCVAPLVDPDCGPCTGLWSDEPLSPPFQRRDLTLHHVQEGYGRTAKRAPSTPSHLVVVCWGHHTKVRQGRIWATMSVNLSRLREYLRDPRKWRAAT